METKRTDAKRLFLLGAGFSKPAGMLTAVELTDLLIEKMLKKPIYDFRFLVDDFKRLHEWAPSLHPINIEDFYEFATHRAERLRLLQHCFPGKRHAGTTPYQQAVDIDTQLQYIDEEMLRLLTELQSNADTATIDRFAAQLRCGDVVATLNYDCLVERSLEKCGRTVDLGMQETPMRDATPVLKLHGSIDWMMVPRNESPPLDKLTKIFSKHDLASATTELPHLTGEYEHDVELYRIHPQSLEGVIRNWRYHQLVFDRRPALAGLGPRKQVSRVPGLGMVWNRTAYALKHADHIVLVGISLSPHDRLLAMELASAMAQRSLDGHTFPHVTAIDPDTTDVLPTRMREIFHTTGHHIRKSHADFDWSCLDSLHDAHHCRRTARL